jgi:hypothetical protein
MRRSQYLNVQQLFRRHIHRIPSLPGDDRFSEGITQARPTGPAGNVFLNRLHTGKRIGDRAISGAAA